MAKAGIEVVVLAALGTFGWRAAGCLPARAVGSSPSGSASAAHVGPRIVFDATSHDFGTVIAGATVVHLFNVKNTGDQSLLLPEVGSSCGCTGAVLKTSQIPPGGSGQVEVRFSPTSTGPTRKVVVVRSNDPRASATRLELTAVVEPDLTYEPGYIRLITDDARYRTARVWLVGVLADQARPGVPELRGEAAGLEQIGVRRIEETQSGTHRRGIELTFKGRPSSSGSAMALLTTGLDDPRQIAIPFSWGESTKLRSVAKR